MPEHPAEDIGSEPKAPQDADSAKNRFPDRDARTNDGIDRGQQRDAITPGGIEESVVADFHADRPHRTKNHRDDSPGNEHPMDHGVRVLLASIRSGPRIAK